MDSGCAIDSDPTLSSSQYPGRTFCAVCQVEPRPGPLCFGSRSELVKAVDAYLANNSNTTELEAKYGWPIGSWCVGKVPSFAGLFSFYRNQAAVYFDEQIGDWNTLNTLDTSEMFRGVMNVKSRFSQDIGNWDVGPVTNVDFMFGLNTPTPLTATCLPGMSGGSPACSGCSERWHFIPSSTDGALAKLRTWKVCSRVRAHACSIAVSHSGTSRM